MKGISTTLVIIVTAIVILVAALVVLTIFGGGMGPIVDLTQARNICAQQVAQSCSITNSVPPTWEVPMQYKVGDKIEYKPCSYLLGCTTCSECLVS